MNQDTFIAALFEALFLPPGLPITLLVIAVALPDPQISSILCVIGFTTLYIVSIPATASWIRSKLETFPPVDLEKTSAEAIVVLGADRYIEAPEYAGDTLNGLGLERLRYAARLHRRTALPILVSGGAVLGETRPESELMRDLLTEEFGVEVRWQEGASRTTYENARFSSDILQAAGVREILLVTHAWAMPRAYEAFTKTGIKVTAAPTGFLRNSDFNTGILAWLPSATALFRTHLALHEMTGRLWYRLRYF